MIVMPTLLVYALSFTAKIKYLLIFFGALIEGPVLMVASGFFLRYGIFSIVPLFIVLVLGDLTGDVLWYYAGYYFAEPLIKKYGKFIGVTPVIFEKGKELFHRYHEKILFLSKITLGFGMAVAILMTAGATKVSFKKYMLMNLLGEFIFITTLLSFGYFFGELYNRVANDFKIAFIIVLIILIGLIFYGVSKYFKRKTLSL
jgi:membrane protein DedA with SNARE-associated domain